MLLIGFIVVQAVVFLVIFFVMRGLMIQNTKSAVNRLKLADGENAKRLEEMKQKIEEAEADYKRRSAELVLELEKQHAAAIKKTEEEKHKLLGKAREESDQILGSAKSRSEKISQELEKEIQARAALLSGQVVRRVLGEEMKTALSEELVGEFFQEIETWDAGHVPEEMREAEIVLPYPLGPDRKKKIREILEKKLARKIELKETVNPDMAGGIVLKLGSLVMDGSLDNKLDLIIRDLKQPT